jgi:hypothetical protein
MEMGWRVEDEKKCVISIVQKGVRNLVGCQIDSNEVPVYQITRCHNPERGAPNNHRRHNVELSENPDVSHLCSISIRTECIAGGN